MPDRKKSNSTKAPRYLKYGLLINAWRNEVKLDVQTVCKESGIKKLRYQNLEKGKVKPTWYELEILAKIFYVGVRDLVPGDDDREDGVIILKDKNARKFDQKRNDRLQYTYFHRAMSTTLPNFKPVELILHITNKKDVVLNRGHFFHQFTQVLHGGPVGFVWKHKNKKHYEEFKEGDSWLIPGFVPHGFWSLDKKNPGRILAVTFGQYLASGDVKQEISLVGPEHASRIISDTEDYYKK